ncbi:TRAP transporter substrate-binding protein DctP [Ponticoccus alexandrii]|uniref:C4-dicarboxylate ABC transporter n=1 Tax=Ponticoccus alexandrii TaxID=1943633 RepID=A0ABX7FF75_9RHOB|nr:TRAP transporter substrate-binding protein DctP [Ponticoccus alexandrii]ETA51968.1 C4-dicarboxylate ABC transporter [Rhodobacteraceae bacterium PD-2]QRF69171.1 C4-dicarboxylate ABC transporter [Ponticoccus alexandrii]
MSFKMARRILLAASVASVVLGGAASAQDKVTLRLSAVTTKTDQRAIAMNEVFGPAVAGFAAFQPHWNGTLFGAGTEREAIATGDLDMSITSAQELATFFPEWSIFPAGYVLQSSGHQVAVFNDPLMDPFKRKVEDELGVKLLAPMYLGKRHVNLRQTQDALNVQTPEDLTGVKLRMPGSDARQFLGRAFGASPVPMSFTEVYTPLQTGSVDGQDNPLSTVVASKFYEVTSQIALTGHLVDWNFIALAKEKYDAMSAEQQEAVTAAAASESAAAAQLGLDDSLVAFLEEKGMTISEPDVAALGSAVQAAYLESDYAAAWPEGVLDAVNALGT